MYLPVLTYLEHILGDLLTKAMTAAFGIVDADLH
jgi:hypothetical protein